MSGLSQSNPWVNVSLEATVHLRVREMGDSAYRKSDRGAQYYTRLWRLRQYLIPSPEIFSVNGKH